MLNMILEALGEQICYTQIRQSKICASMIDFALADTQWQSDTIYIATEEMLTLSELRLPVTIILGECSSEISKYQGHKGNIIATTCSIPELYRKVNRVITRIRGWKELLDKTAFSDEPMEAAMDVWAKEIKGEVIFTDEKEQILYRASYEGHTSKEEYEKQQRRVLDIQITMNAAKVGRLTFLTELEETAWHQALLEQAAEYIIQLLRSNKGCLQKQDEAVNKLIVDLINGKIEGQGVFEQRASILHSPFNANEEGMRYYHVLVIKLPNIYVDNSTKYMEFCSVLNTAIPMGNFTYYKKQIVGLFITKELVHYHKSDLLTLEEILKKYNAYGAYVGIGSRYYRIRTLYQMCLQGIRIGKILFAKEERHLFFPKDDYIDYMSIDLMHRAFTSIYGHDDIGYFISSRIMELIRYDKQNKSNFHDILYYYLASGGSIVKTAQILEVHKNTVANKIDQIEKLVGGDLSDRETQFELLLSFKILNYFELCTRLPPEVSLTDIPGDALIQ